MLDPYDLTQKNVIYALHAGDRVYRYVGLTTGTAAKRFYEHRGHASGKWKTASRSYVYNWMNKIGIENVVCEVLQVCEVDDINAWEMIWIEHLKNLEYPLTNLTDGGEGLLGYQYSTEQRLARSERQRGELGPRALMSSADVVSMWDQLRAGVRPREIEGISYGTIHQIMHGNSWIAEKPVDFEEIKSFQRGLQKEESKQRVTGDANHTALLKNTDIPRIWDRLRMGETAREISPDYGVKSVTIRAIMRGNTWRDFRPDDAHEIHMMQNDLAVKNNCGAGSPASKLNDLQVAEIKVLANADTGLNQKELAKRFGVSISTISSIKNGRTWAHIKTESENNHY